MLSKFVKEIVLVFDGTCTKRGGFTKIGNAQQYKIKKDNHGKSTKAHMFLMGLLLIPGGIRLPFTRYTYYTKEYCRKNKIKYKKQTQLAILMMEELLNYVGPGIKIIAAADSYFDCKEIFKFCRQQGITFITRADRARTYFDNNKKKKISSRRERNRLKAKTMRISDSEFSRNNGGHGKKKRIYRASSEILSVSGLGETRVVFSWKMNKKDSFIVLLCSDLNLATEKIIEYYHLRWQIEVFFREMKSHLGLCNFTGQDFRAYERYVDLCLISYMALEYYRIKKIQETKSVKEKAELKKGYISTIKKFLEHESNQETIKYIQNHPLKSRKIAA